MCYSHFMRSPFYSLLLVVSFLFLLGSLALLFALWPREVSRPRPLATNSPAVTTLTEEASYEGTIFRDDSLATTSLATHRLLDSHGQTAAFLQSGKIDLRILQPGLKVLVSGRREKILENNLPLISVDKLTFR